MPNPARTNWFEAASHRSKTFHDMPTPLWNVEVANLIKASRRSQKRLTHWTQELVPPSR